MLALWTTVLLVRSILNIKNNLKQCGQLRINQWTLRLNICLILLCQISQLTQFIVMMQFFWNPRVDKEWVHKMDVVDDILNAGITAIYLFVFSSFSIVEQRIRELYPDWEKNGIVGLFSNNPMLRYRTHNGPITSPMGLLALSTMSQSHNAYYLTVRSSSLNSSKQQLLTRESQEREK